ncbi:MAG: NCS2 family permease [Planctomycetaceae bacterium]|nr:NCS2 family permease [Planctomycetaceae bacterium]
MKLFVKRDLDGFFGLFVDNLVQLLMIIGLCSSQVGMTGENSRFLYELILPGAAISIIFGNVFYAFQAHRLAKREGRTDVTALPYGINTPSLIVYVFFVMAPEFQRTGSVDAAWRLGLLACIGSGLIEFFGAFVADWIRRHTPRAALLSTLAGIAIGFISMTFALEIFHKPLIAMVPLAIVLVGLFSRITFPLGLPGGFLAILIGTAAAWAITGLEQVMIVPSWITFGALDPSVINTELTLRYPQWCGPAILAGLKEVQAWMPFLSVVIPMGLFNVIGSLQNIESAEAAGDKYPAASAMAMNGLGTILAGCFGSCFPTTIYIGHPGWKGLGARAGYSTLNGVVIVAITVLGLLNLIAAVVPMEAGAAIILWIGIIITAQAFQATKQEHAPAVAIGLFPAIAAWGATVMLGTVMTCGGKNLYDLVAPVAPVPVVTAVDPNAGAAAPGESAVSPVQLPAKSSTMVNGFLVHGLLLMERGYIFTCMILAAAAACLIDRKFGAAAIWMVVAAVCTFLGMMHAYQVYPIPGANIAIFDYLFRFMAPVSGAYAYRADDIVVGYLLSALTYWLVGRWARNQPEAPLHL